jgi:hypothetical protein
MVRAYAVTIPAGTFDAGAGTFVLGLFKIATKYKFSQRRTDIEDLVENRRSQVVENEKDRLIAKLENLKYPTCTK